MGSLEIIERLCLICATQGALIRDMARSLAEEDALAYAGVIEKTEGDYREIVGEEMGADRALETV